MHLRYIATEALPLELHRNYTLIRQLDESAEGEITFVKSIMQSLFNIKCTHTVTFLADLMSTVADECKVLTSNKYLSREERLEKLRNVSSLLNETVKRGEEKFALAKSTYDTVCTIHLENMDCLKSICWDHVSQ